MYTVWHTVPVSYCSSPRSPLWCRIESVQSVTIQRHIHSALLENCNIHLKLFCSCCPLQNNKCGLHITQLNDFNPDLLPDLPWWLVIPYVCLAFQPEEEYIIVHLYWNALFIMCLWYGNNARQISCFMQNRLNWNIIVLRDDCSSQTRFSIKAHSTCTT